MFRYEFIGIMLSCPRLPGMMLNSSYCHIQGHHGICSRNDADRKKYEDLIACAWVVEFRISADLYHYSGASLERVQRVHLHPLKFGNGCNAPVLNGTLSTKNHQLGKNHRFQCLQKALCTRPMKNLTRPLPLDHRIQGLQKPNQTNVRTSQARYMKVICK